MECVKTNNVKNKTDKTVSKKGCNNVLVIDEEMRKIFQEKRRARQEELKAKIENQRKNSAIDMNKGTIPKKLEIKSKIDTNKRVIVSSKKPEVIKTNVKIPQIKQTTASKLRMQKNNPFHGLELDDIKKILEAQSSHNASIQPSKTNTQLDTRKTLSDRKLPKSTDNFTDKRFSRLELLSKPKVLNHKLEQTKEDSNPNKSAKRNKLPIRRSISSDYIRRKSGRVEANHFIHNNRSMVKAQSIETVNFRRNLNIPSPISEKSEPSTSRINCIGRKTVMFVSPSRRRSRSLSPINQTPLPSELRGQLMNWLKKRGKSLNAYRHLRCFGVHQSTPYRPARKSVLHNYDDEDENKENNAEYASMISTDSSDIPKIIDYTNFTTNDDIFGTPNVKANTKDMNQLARDVLCDLHALILEKYPPEQCTDWLNALKRKYPNLQSQPQYWECRAALSEINGEFNEAVECYQEAIIKGAEVNKIDHSIEQLLEKFSVLDLSSSTRKQDTTEKKQRSKIILDARNIFKSSVIKFAVSQRETRSKLKDQAEALTPLVAKPVRRSTRKSVSCYSTPKEEVYNSLREIETSLRKSVCFEKNQALIDNS